MGHTLACSSPTSRRSNRCHAHTCAASRPKKSVHRPRVSTATFEGNYWPSMCAEVTDTPTIRTRAPHTHQRPLTHDLRSTLSTTGT